MRWFASLALAFALAGSACAQERSDTQIIDVVPNTASKSVRTVTQSNPSEPSDKFQVFKNIAVKNCQPKPNFIGARVSKPSEEERRSDWAMMGKIHDLYKKRDASPSCDWRTYYAPFICDGIAEQGGVVSCLTRANAKVKVGRSEDDFYFEQADADGKIIIGFDRDEEYTFVEADHHRIDFKFKPREYDTSRIDGLPPSQVSTFTDAQLKRIRSSSARKKVGFSSRAKELGFKNGFISPVKEFRKTTNFGAQRILNGEPKRPHYGVDLAAPVGTPIYAPADGIVSLADDDLYFEGAMVLLDHGQGLISMYLHVNEITVENGQRVKQGEQIATVGSKGRSTGPHLCWRLKWRNRNLDPELLTEWPQDG